MKNLMNIDEFTINSKDTEPAERTNIKKVEQINLSNCKVKEVTRYYYVYDTVDINNKSIKKKTELHLIGSESKVKEISDKEMSLFIKRLKKSL
jgi:hypothetical protein